MHNKRSEHQALADKIKEGIKNRFGEHWQQCFGAAVQTAIVDAEVHAVAMSAAMTDVNGRAVFVYARDVRAAVMVVCGMAEEDDTRCPKCDGSGKTGGGRTWVKDCADCFGTGQIRGAA